ncbi:unnamed protein product [Prunus armeniaca]
MKGYGFKQSQDGHLELETVTVIVFVDDIVVTRNDTQEIEELNNYLAKQFEMNDLGALKYFLRIEVSGSKQGIFLSHCKYILDLLVKTGKSACEPIDTPIIVKYQPTWGDINGWLGSIYVAHNIHDLSYAVSVILMKELGFGSTKPMVLYCDKTIAINLANDFVQHDRTKHIAVERNFIEDNLVNDVIEVPYIKRADWKRRIHSGARVDPRNIGIRSLQTGGWLSNSCPSHVRRNAPMGATNFSADSA